MRKYRFAIRVILVTLLVCFAMGMIPVWTAAATPNSAADAPLSKDEKSSMALSQLFIWSIMESAKTEPKMETDFRGVCQDYLTQTIPTDRLDRYLSSWTLQTCSQWHTEKKEYEKALALINRDISLYGEKDENLVVRAQVYWAMGDQNKGLSEFDRAIKLYPDKYWPTYMRGRLFLSQNKYQAALADFDAAKRILTAQQATAPDTITRDTSVVWSGAGRALYGLERYDDALSEFTTSLTIKENSQEGLVGRANTCYKLKRYEESLTEYDKYMKLINPPSDVHRFRGELLDLLGRYEEAAKECTTALALDPSNYAANYVRALSYRGLNQKTEAAADLRQFIEKAPATDKYLGQAKKMLAELE